MKKRILTGTALAVSTLFITFTAFAENVPQNQTGNFYFTQNGKEIHVSCNGELFAGARNTDFVLGFYDNDVLINTELIKSGGTANSLNVGEFTVVLPQEPQNLSIKSFMWSADGTCEPLDTAAEISNIPSNAFECNGYVISNPKSDFSLNYNEIKFIVMKSENFDGYSYGFTDEYDDTSIVERMNVGNTDISDHLFQYVKAYIVKDSESNEYRILNYSPIENFETNQTVEMKLADVTLKNGVFDFKNHEISKDAIVYVNNCEADVFNAADIKKLKEQNQYENAKVTLVDSINRNDGTIDGIYDYVFVDCYESAVVDYVLTNNKIYFSESSAGDSVFYYDEEYMNINVYDSRGIKIGKEELQKLENGTKLYFAYDMVNCGDLSEAEIIDIIIDKEIEPKEIEKTSEFKIKNVMNTLYISSSDNKNILGGNIKISSEGNMPALTADLIFYEGEKEVYTKVLEFPKYANQISLNETEIGDYTGTPTKVELKIIGGDIEYYSKDIPITGSEKLYYVNGRITEIPKQSELGQGKVRFSVESTDDFDGKSYGISSKYDKLPENYIMNIGEINPDDFMFMYSEALISKDESTGEFTIISISPYDTNNIIGIDTKDISDSDTTTGKIAVYESETSLKTYKYDLSSDAVMYVNGVSIGAVNEDNMIQYIYENQSGKLSLIDATALGSTSTDGRYEYILIDYYSTAVVDSVEDEKINFKASSYDIDSSMYCNENTKIIKDGETITADQLNRNDVLSIKFDPVSGFRDSDFYEIQVSSKTVEGRIVSRNYDHNTVKIDANEYYLNYKTAGSAGDYDLNTSYRCYLDVFGNIVYADEAINQKDYGIIVGMFKSAGNDYMSVRLITAAGDIKIYECKDSYYESEFISVIGGNETDLNQDGQYSKAEIENAVGIENCVVEYVIISNKIRLKDVINPVCNANVEYSADTSQFGEYLYDNTIARIVYIGEYINGGDVYSVKESNLINGQIYDIYGYDMSVDRNIRFFMIKNTASEAFKDLEANPVIPDNPDIDDPISDKEGIGFVTAMYYTAGNDYITVRLITNEGEIENYECKDANEESEFIELIGGIGTDSNGDRTYSKSEIENSVGIMNTAVKFSVRNSKIVFEEKLQPEYMEMGIYDEKASTIENISIDDCILIDMSGYVRNIDDKVYIISKDMLDNGSIYDIVKMDNIIYFIEGAGKLQPTTPLAVVKSFDDTEVFNGCDCTALTVIRDNQETQIYIDDVGFYIEEGAIISYVVGLDGIVEPDNIAILFEPSNDYDSMRADTLSKDNFADMINADKSGDMNEYGGKLIQINGNTDPDIYSYFGILYQTTPNGFEMFTNRQDNSPAVSFNITSDTKIVTYDYGNRAYKGSRVEISNIPTQVKQIFNPYYTDSSYSVIDWEKVAISEDCRPALVFAKTDGDTVTDMVVYLAADY